MLVKFKFLIKKMKRELSVMLILLSFSEECLESQEWIAMRSFRSMQKYFKDKDSTLTSQLKKQLSV